MINLSSVVRRGFHVPLLYAFAALGAAAIGMTTACSIADPNTDPANDSRAGTSISGQTNDSEALAGTCANGPTVFGIDVSYFNESIDWARAKAAGVQYAFIRVSDGTGFRDPKFASYWAGARAQGILRGAYQFFRPSQNVIAQADLLVDTMGALNDDDLPPVIDVEATGNLSPSSVAAKVTQWIDRVKSRTGRTPIIYTGKFFWRDQVGGSTQNASSPLWLAQYTSSLCPDLPLPWKTWTFWQYSETGKVAGISGDVDLNRFNGNLDELRALTRGGASYQPMGVSWQRASSGAFTFTAAAVPSAVEKVQYTIDGFAIGDATRAAGFALTYTFNNASTERQVEVRGLDAAGKQVALAVGLMDSIAGTGVFIRETGAREYEIGLERAPAEVAAIEVVADDQFLLTDGVSGSTRPTRKAVLVSFSQLGSRKFTIRTYNSDGSLRGALSRTFTLR